MAIEKEIISDNGEVRRYFKINKVSLDYENNSFNVECSSYIDKSYRDKEKVILAKHKKLKKEFEELSNKPDKTEDELGRLYELNIAEIENRIVNLKPLRLKVENFSIEMTEELRQLFYEALKQKEIFAGAQDILEDNSLQEEVDN